MVNFLKFTDKEESEHPLKELFNPDSMLSFTPHTTEGQGSVVSPTLLRKKLNLKSGLTWSTQ